MTNEEQNNYYKLTPELREEYDHLMKKHPNWSHNQIMTKLSLDAKTEVMVSNGKEIDPEDPRILKEILEGAKEILVGMGIIITAVFTVIDDTLDALGDLISGGVSYIGDKLSEFWDWLTN